MNVQLSTIRLARHNNRTLKKENERTPAFKSFNLAKAARIETELAKKGINCNFANDGFAAECTQKVVNLFGNLFGRSSLPKRVLFEPSPPWIYGRYFNGSDTVCINSEHAFFQTMQGLREHSQSKAGKFASTHPAQVYIHEFAHAANWHHLKDTLGSARADRVWREFEGKRVPTAIGQVLTYLKLGNYALNANDMCEFAAERATYDICNSITPETWEKMKNVDIGYSSIFDRRRNSTCLYGHTVTPAYYTDENSPQAFLDRYMQNTWNGDIREFDMANSKLGEVLEYLRWGKFIKNRLFF